MKTYLRHSRFFKTTALALVLLQLCSMGASELLASAATEVQKALPKGPTANRTVPKVQPVAAFPVFSDPPLDAEIMRARVFEEPLVAMAGTTSEEENRDLARAITAYLKSADTENLMAFEAFLVKHPQSTWKPALLTNMGLVYRKTGYFSKALEVWEDAWALSKTETARLPRAIGDRAVAEWAELNARLGRFDTLKTIFEETESRDIAGSSGEKVRNAKEGLWLMENRPQDAFRCGPMALDRILAFEKPEYATDDLLLHSRSTKQGMSLVQVRDLGNSLGMNLQMAAWDGTGDVLLPAVVHWKAGHYAALLKQENGRFLVQDPTFGDELWVSRKALQEEASGFFLVRSGELPAGWAAVQKDLGEKVWGKGATGTQDGTQIKKGDPKCDCPELPALPMAQYNVHLMMLNLTISDTPVGYLPPRGPAVAFEVTYNHRESFQPGIFTYANLGPNWTFDWMSYINDNPSNLSASVYLYARGGGQETYSGFNSGTQSYAASLENRTVVVRTSSSPIRYERRHPDGSVEVFEQSDGAASRKVFLTEWKDASGNTVTFTYDSSLRVTAVTDAIGQVTVVDYELSSDPLKVTKVTDPFGRYARFDYDSAGRLQRITDIVGIQSSFNYDTGTFINGLTTPYGRTTFFYNTEGITPYITRTLEITDPDGATERFVGKHGATGISSTDAAYPTGILNDGGYLQFRNTYHWDKKAWADHPGDFTKSTIYHWFHSVNSNVTSGYLSYSKKPLENKVWYQYDGQTSGTSINTSTFRQPIKIARLLDDGSTQLYQYAYNKAGKLIKAIDPLGRETQSVYGTGSTPDTTPATGTGIDLLEVKQKNGASLDTLASFTYDSAHRPLTQTDAALQTTTFTYRSTGDLETIVTPARGSLTTAQRATTLSYYADNASLGAGQVEEVTGPVSGATTSFVYDSKGRVRTVTGSDGYALTTDYDDMNRPTLVTYPDSTTEEMIYSKLDLVRSRDRQNRWSYFFYDANRRLILSRDSLGRTVQQEWCLCDALSKLTDAAGNVTRWDFDDQNRAVTETRVNSSTTQFVYENTTSRLKRRTDARGQHTDYAYFKDGNLQQTSYPNAVIATPTVSFTYDTIYNRVATMVDGIGTTSYTYHGVTTGTGTLGATQLATVDGPLSNDVIAYTYDELGRSLSRSINSVSASQTYDVLGRVDAVTNALGAFGYAYVNETSRLSTVSYPNGQSTAFSYLSNSADRRLSQIHNQLSGSVTLSKFDYTYDTVGNITTWTQQRDNGGSAVTRAYDFTYDAEDQILSAIYRTTGGSPTILKRYNYTYDSAGNRTNEQLDDDTRQSSYDNMNRLTSQGAGGALYFSGSLNEAATVTIAGKPATVLTDNTFSGKVTVPSGTSTVDVAAKDYAGNLRTTTYEVTQTATAKTFTYDANGNMTGDGTRTFEWDAENRLLAVENGTHRSEFTYDGQSRRIRIVEKDSGSTTSDTVYLWCGLDICEERDSTGATTNKRFFAQGEQQGSSAFFYTRDHLGSIRELTDNSAGVSARYDYDPYGRRSKLSGSGDTTFGFTGHLTHAATGLVIAPFRAYDPEIGRWISPDPIGLAGGLNYYAYVVNDPVNGLDPLGLDKISPPKEIYLEDILAPLGNAAAGGTDAFFPGLGGYLGGSSIDPCSTAYKIGWWASTGLQVAVTAGEAAAARAAASKAAAAGKAIASEGTAAAEGGAGVVRNLTKQFKKLTKGEIKKLEKAGIDPHDLKPNSKYDLFKNKKGDIVVKPKNGKGPGDPTGINIKDF